MKQTLSRAVRFGLAALGLAALIATALIGPGCLPTEEEIGRMSRRNQDPPGYNDFPMGPDYDTHAKAMKLNDAALRDWMLMWFHDRKVYGELWREHGDYDRQVKDIYNRLRVLRVCIQDRVRALLETGQPL